MTLISADNTRCFERARLVGQGFSPDIHPRHHASRSNAALAPGGNTSNTSIPVESFPGVRVSKISITLKDHFIALQDGIVIGNVTAFPPLFARARQIMG
jgi:hypothetical protein